jgi:hypothetical protein
MAAEAPESPQESLMAKRRRTLPDASGSPAKAVGRQPKPDTIHSSVYLPTAVHDALREAAFKERAKIHDLVLEGIELALRKRGYPSIDDLKAKFERKR